MRKCYVLIFLLSAVMLMAAHAARAEVNVYRDGVYEGEHAFVKVRVTVKGGKISAIEILHHGGGGAKYEAMVEPLKTAIIEKQSTEVDGITGATVSSRNLIRAVKNALELK